ncbi:tRNA synthetases class I, catalytic domain-containing protein [Glomus cerebriforme]|uniref:glutamine--tRNA ligase n=1 Tax=Glomus cerebriforme TaxID=658196 RepID=A0A397T7Y0_9GLOM|nr:tRNA synthetases class I, catalytic domain-containing protein [Glomus cerebriforme]
MADNELVNLFQSIGLTEQRAKDTAKNKKLAPTLRTTIAEAGVSKTGCDKATGSLLYTLASTITKDANAHLGYITRAITDKKLKTAEQVAAAIKFAENAGDEIVDADFENACGVGVMVTPERISNAISSFLESKKESLIKDRYKLLGPLLAQAKQIPELRWANGVTVKEELEKQVVTLIGPKDERDMLAKGKKKDTDQKKPNMKVSGSSSNKSDRNSVPNMFLEGELAKLHRPGGNKQINPELMEQHLKETGGKVITRFPPEPNGFLHIGHAKAINVNFGYAKTHNGFCYLRYDDTNPEAEEEIYFTSIKETIEWLGFSPWKITYSSDYFDKLYELAIELIKCDKAYACSCTPEEMHEMRGGDDGGERRECIHRNRPINESLTEFEKMKEGRYKEGQVTIRMKMDMQSGNPQFWDLVAYRILYTPHHRTGDKWCIYPTYDYTHCLCDSFENITHSLCTLEFRMSRESYYWLCDALEVYKPVQFEYNRLKINNTITSKRKIAKLVNEGYVEGWDDPRLYTLPALRRRGVPPEAINGFVQDLGVTTSNSTIQVSRFDKYVRDYLDAHAPRLMLVVDPIKIIIENLPDDYIEELTIPFKPKVPSMGEHVVPFSKTVYIDKSDFREQDSPDYFRLAVGKTVGLLYVNHCITCTSIKKDPEGNIEYLICQYESGLDVKKPKTYIQWVSESTKHKSPIRLNEVKIYNNLFISENPLAHPEGFLKDIYPDSLKIATNSLIEIGLNQVISKSFDNLEKKYFETVRFQAIRVGYFCLDKDSFINENNEIENKYILNKIVSLKEDPKKN